MFTQQGPFPTSLAGRVGMATISVPPSKASLCAPRSLRSVLGNYRTGSGTGTGDDVESQDVLEVRPWT